MLLIDTRPIQTIEISTEYKVNVIDRLGMAKTLIGSLRSREEVLFIENKIEEILEDENVLEKLSN